jgi:flagellar secretion chaperone FliS
MQTAGDAYLETQVMTASPERLHLMLVDGAMRFARAAEAALEKNDFETAFSTLTRSRGCLSEMLVAIKDAPNPELAANLKALFMFVHRNLIFADIEHNVERVRDSLKILEMHRQTWLEVIERTRPEKSEPALAISGEPAVTSWTT